MSTLNHLIFLFFEVYFQTSLSSAALQHSEQQTYHGGASLTLLRHPAALADGSSVAESLSRAESSAAGGAADAPVQPLAPHRAGLCRWAAENVGFLR